MSSVSSPRSESQGMLHARNGSLLHAARFHKRFKLRAVAITSVAAGLILNFTTLMVAVLARNSEGPRIVTGLAFLPLVISMVWHHLDLASPRILSKPIAWTAILFMDTLGFLGFLAVLIANGLISTDYSGFDYGGVPAIPPLMIYNSMPWLVCCSIHAMIALKEAWEHLPDLARKSHRGNGCSQCAHCRTEWSTQTKKPQSRAGYSLLGERDAYDEDADVQPETASMSEPGQGQSETAPLTLNQEGA